MSRILTILTFALGLVGAVSVAQDREGKNAPVWRIYPLQTLVPREDSALRQVEEPEFGLLGVSPLESSAEAGRIEQEETDASVIASTLQDLFGEIYDDVGFSKIGSGAHVMVTAPPAAHARFEKTLEQLRTQAGGAFELDVRSLKIPKDLMTDSVRDLLRSAAAGRLDAEGKRKLEAIGKPRGGTLHALPGEWTTYRASREVRYLPNFDVEIAQGSSISDPVPAIATDGLVATVRPFRLKDGRVLLRVVASFGDLDDAFRRFGYQIRDLAWLTRRPSNEFVELELADYRGAGLSTEVIVNAGGTAGFVLGRPGGADADTHVLLLTVNKGPETPAASTFTVVTTGALTAPDVERSLNWGDTEGRGSPRRLQMSDEVEPVRFAFDDLERMLQDAAGHERRNFVYGAEWLHGGSVITRMTPEEAKRVQETVARLERTLLHPLVLTIRLVSGTGESAKEVAVAAVPLLTDRRVAFAAYHELEYVGDYDVEVAQEARIADPNRHLAYSGLFCNVKVLRDGPQRYRTRLDLRLSAFTQGIRQIEHGSPSAGAVQSVPTDTRHLRSFLDMRRGETKTLELGGNPFSTVRGTPLHAQIRLD